MSEVESSLLDKLRDRDTFISFGLVLSLKPGDQEKVRHWLEANGVKIIFQTTTARGNLYLLREYQVLKAIRGDTSQLREIYAKKQRGPPGAEVHQTEERRVEK